MVPGDGDELTVIDLLRRMVEAEASDLHLQAGTPPVLRVHGRLAPLDLPALTAEAMTAAFGRIATAEQQERFWREKELDFAYAADGTGRFRVNAGLQRGSIALAVRFVKARVPGWEALGLPEICRTLALKPHGLVLVTGSTGSGKSTTLAAMIDYLNERERRHIVTIEDPIEFLHRNKQCLISQRELGADTTSFAAALKHVLRQDPDVVLIGEMRDPETIASALTAAETGQLVLSTLHTPTAAHAIDRITDSFPPHQQQQIRMQLSTVLEAVLCQALVPRARGPGRAAAVEVLVATPAVENLIREGKTFQIPNVMQTGSKHGMRTLDQALAALCRTRVIAPDEALPRCINPEQFQRALGATPAPAPGMGQMRAA